MKILLVLSILFSLGCENRKPPAPESQQVRPAKIMTISGSSDFDEFEFTGRVEALQTSDLSFEVGGRLINVAVKEGEEISQGTLIANLDPTSFLLAVQEAEVQLKLSRQDLSRKRKLLQENGIAKSIVDDAQANYELMGVKLAQAKKRLRDTKIFAPFDAYISRRYFDNFVNVGPGVSIVKLHDLEKLQIIISVPESMVATASTDSILEAWAEFSFARDQKFEMEYYENRGEADELAQTYEVAFIINPNETINLLPGMTASVHVNAKRSNPGNIFIPASAIVPTPDNSLAVWIYDETTQTVERRKIKTLSPTLKGVPVSAGLKIGERIIVSGASQLQEGMRVRPLE
jgi:RND family efflux transporter MFP subunit